MQEIQSLEDGPSHVEHEGLQSRHESDPLSNSPTGHVSQDPLFNFGNGLEHDKQSFEFGPLQVLHVISQILQDDPSR